MRHQPTPADILAANQWANEKGFRNIAAALAAFLALPSRQLRADLS